MEETKKTGLKEKMSKMKTKVKDFVHDHKKALIKGGIVAGAVAATTGVVAAGVNRCGLPGGCGSCEYEEIDIFDFESDVDPSDDDSENISEETTEEE